MSPINPQHHGAIARLGVLHLVGGWLFSVLSIFWDIFAIYALIAIVSAIALLALAVYLWCSIEDWLDDDGGEELEVPDYGDDMSVIVDAPSRHYHVH